MISERISDDIPPQMKILNMVIPHSNAILQFCFKLEAVIQACYPMKCDVINDVKLFSTVSQDIMSQFFDVIQIDVAVTKASALEYIYIS